MRLDLMALKQNEQIKQQELEQFFQNSSMQYFEKIQETAREVDRLKQSSMGANNISNVVDILEQEVIDLKNNKRTQNMRNTDTTDGVGGNRVDLLIEEINQLWNFV